MVEIAGWQLQRNDVRWRSSDGTVLFYRTADGWSIHAEDDASYGLLDAAGYDDQQHRLNSFKDVQRFVIDVLGCSSQFIQDSPSYKVCETPYTLIRDREAAYEQWFFRYSAMTSAHISSYRADYDSPMWRYVNAQLNGDPLPYFATRASALESLTECIELFDEQ